MWSLTDSIEIRDHKVHVTSPLRMGWTRREESKIIILGNLGEVCLYSKRRVGSASTDSKRINRSLTKSTLSFPDGIQEFDFIFSIEETPLHD